MNKKIFLQHPSIIFSSILDSVKINRNLKVNIFTTFKTRIKIKKEAELNVGKAWIGIGITRVGEIFSIKDLKTYITIGKRGIVEMGQNVQIGPGCIVNVGSSAKLEIGSGTEITGDCKILVCEKIKIGENCMIAWNVQIMDTDWHTTSSNKGECISQVEIGDSVWIASGVKIMKGVTIGRGAVIAAGSIVLNDVPCNTLFGGIPGKVIRENYEWKV